MDLVILLAMNGLVWGLIVALIALSVLGLINSGPISAIIGVLTIVGAVQALERSPQSAA